MPVCPSSHYSTPRGLKPFLRLCPLMILFSVFALLAGCRSGAGNRRPAADAEERSAAEAALDDFISAQENGDAHAAAAMVVESGRQAFKTVLEKLDRDDLVATGLQFRQEDYRLQDISPSVAVFWSDRARLFLVLSKEHGNWLIDPAATDEMNAQD